MQAVLDRDEQGRLIRNAGIMALVVTGGLVHPHERIRVELSAILNWGETIGTLTKNGLLDTDLVLDWLWVSGIWARVGPAARKQRDKHCVPELYENFEALAAKQEAELFGPESVRSHPGTNGRVPRRTRQRDARVGQPT